VWVERNLKIIKMLVVCCRRGMEGFTYGRLYVFMVDPDMYLGCTWVKNDQGHMVGRPKNNFMSLKQWKELNSISETCRCS